MDKIKQMQMLIAKIGVFFANSDGEYDSHEQKFIENFIKESEKENQLTDDILHIIRNMSKSNESLENIIQETKSLLTGFNETEQITIKNTLSDFIYKVIEADGIIHPKEVEYYNSWKTEMGIE